MKTLMRSGVGRSLGAVVLGASIVACHPPMLETTAQAQTTQGTDAGTQATTAERGYSSSTNPFALSPRLREMLGQINSNPDATTRQKVERLFELLHRGAENGVRVVDGEGRAPRTAAEAYEQGGDCTELANIVIALLKEMSIDGGAQVVHFNSAPAEVYHMIPYAQVGSERVVVDLQAASLGSTASGAYSTILTLNYNEAAYMYHAEQGDYLMAAGRNQEAIAAYGRAIEICDRDAYVHHNLGILYEGTGDMQAAARHHGRAAELAPERYRREAARGTYNEELQAGQQAAEQREWADCVRHLQNALDSGERLVPEERQMIVDFRDACAERAGQ